MMNDNDFEEIRMSYTDLAGSEFDVTYMVAKPNDQPDGLSKHEAVVAICRAANCLLTSLDISNYKLCVHTTDSHHETCIHN